MCKLSIILPRQISLGKSIVAQERLHVKLKFFIWKTWGIFGGLTITTLSYVAEYIECLVNTNFFSDTTMGTDVGWNILVQKTAKWLDYAKLCL